MPPLMTAPVPAAGPTLRRLFLTLFLRGRSSRGLRQETTPKSIGSKLGLILAVYAAMGLVAVAFRDQSVFALSASVHAMTFLLLGMFIAASGGEILFNKEEADILLHRPVPPRTLLWAKVRVLVEVSLWLAGALNLVSFVVGTVMPGGSWLFPVAHATSIVAEALFCTGCVVLVYELCLRWFGRDRLEGLMTAAQVVVAVAAAAGGQIVPRVIDRLDQRATLDTSSWWLRLLPPAWFASFDDAVAGSGGPGSWALAGLGLLVTGAVVALAFGKLGRDYERGLQLLSESPSAARRQRAGRPWFDGLVEMPPIRWWLGDSVSRAAFLLTAAYLVRDRDVKLRIYPSLAPLLVMPFVVMLRPARRDAGFGLALTGAFLGMLPMLALGRVRFSQQWQAADVFRAAPVRGPAELCHGARRAVLCVLTAPCLIVLAAMIWFLKPPWPQPLLLLPGMIALPVFALVPCLDGKAVPFSVPNEEAKAAGRGPAMLGIMMTALLLSLLAVWAQSSGWFWQLVLMEAALVAALYALLRHRVSTARWRRSSNLAGGPSRSVRSAPAGRARGRG